VKEYGNNQVDWVFLDKSSSSRQNLQLTTIIRGKTHSESEAYRSNIQMLDRCKQECQMRAVKLGEENGNLI
jgi:hypothetical protein